jgi:hypothetical protein
MQNPAPTRPAAIDPLAAELLAALQAFPATRHFVLGGYFALKHYCDYRPTHDVDAWWDPAAGEAERGAARAALRTVLGPLCERHQLNLHRRHFGDTESWELARGQTKVFSFQIATRTVQLEPYLASPWPPLQIESLADNAGSKMNALVQRAAPRDFVDVRHLVLAGLLTPAECWRLWQRKNPDLVFDDARAELARRLHELELRRPLETIADSAERERADAARRWFREVFLASQP